MPHVDGLSLPTLARGAHDSRFAAPVAAITRFVSTSLDNAKTAAARWQARRSEQALVESYARKAAQVRKREDAFTTAADHHELERMQRAWDRRDGGGLRDWDWL